MSTNPRRHLRYLVPLLGAAALLLLTAGASVAGSAGSSPARRTAARSARAAKPVLEPAVVPKGKITISLSHRLRRGNLVVLLDGAMIFNEEFVKDGLVISQTTVWDPVEAPAGKHTLVAQVKGKNGKTYLSDTYDLRLSQTDGIEIRIRMKRDKLEIDPVS